MRSQGTWCDHKYNETTKMTWRPLKTAEPKNATAKKPRSSPGHADKTLKMTLGSEPKPSALRSGTLAGAKKIDLKCFSIKKKT